MIKDTDDIVMIFEFDKYDNDYKFHSLAKAKYNDGYIEILSGELNGKTDLSELVFDGPILDTKKENGTAKIISNKNIIQVYYKVPNYNFLSYSTPEETCANLCAIGAITRLKLADRVDYGRNLSLSVHKNFNNLDKAYTLCKEHFEEIKEMLDVKYGKNKKDDEELNPIKFSNNISTYIVTRREKFDRSSPKVNIGTIGVQREIVEGEEPKRKNIDINEIINGIKKKIVGQDNAIESVVANIYANQIMIEKSNKDLIASQKSSILLDGTTGTGKTAIVKEVSDKLSLPIVITSITDYSPTGYVGNDLTSILTKLLDKTDGNLELAERGIVCLDEFDKLGQDPKDINNLKLKSAVQQELLAFIGGSKINFSYRDNPIEFDTTNITFIAMGAFTKIRDEKIAKINESKKVIGFNTQDDISDENKYVITEQNYIEYGLQRELVGRFSLLTSTRTYTVEDYKNILLNSSISPLAMFKEFCKGFGIEEVNYSDDFIDMMAQMAYEDNFGARGLQKIIANLKNTLLLDIINNKTQSITLTTDMLVKVREKNVRTY